MRKLLLIVAGILISAGGCYESNAKTRLPLVGKPVQSENYSYKQWKKEQQEKLNWTTEWMEKSLVGQDTLREIAAYRGKRNRLEYIDTYITLGMVAGDVQSIFGSPDDINRSVGRWGTHEQWVYEDVYFYFKNGILTSWQD